MRVADAYAACGEITRREARNFALGIMVLPRPKREALTALYAFARRVDDIADGADPPAVRAAALAAVRDSLDTLPRVPAGDPVLIALRDAMVRYPIPRGSLLALLDGAQWDVERSRYETWSELRAYCLRVAGAVGVACTAVYGPTDLTRAVPLAELLGIALQQINIMRDVREDWLMGRVYLPQDELAHHGVTEEDLAAGTLDASWRELMELQANRARAHLVGGFGLLDLLDARSSLCVRTLAGVYSGLLDEIAQCGFDVFSARAGISTGAKLRVAGVGIIGVLAGRAPRVVQGPLA